MRKCFVNFPTESEAKIREEKKLDEHLRANGIEKANGLALMLVGHAETGYDRHLNRGIGLGFSESQIVFLDDDPRTYASLRRYKLKHRYKNHVLYGDIIKVIDLLVRKGFTIAYVEADGVDGYGKFDFALYTVQQKYQIPYMSINGVTRRPTKEFTLEAAKLSIRRTVDKRVRHNGPRYDMKRVIPIVAKNKLPKSCEITCNTYRGVSSMYTSTIINKKWIK